MSDERRQFRRVKAPILIQPLGPSTRHQLRDVSLGGLRAYSDEPHELGERLQLELLLPDHSSVTVQVEVAWVNALGPEEPARYDVGMRYLDIDTEDVEKLNGVLESD